MNTKSRGISALGLFIGRDHAHTFLNIDSDFFNVKHLNGEGRLVAIDVWGVGGRASADEQSSMRQWEDKQVEKSRKVCLAHVRVSTRPAFFLFVALSRSNDRTKTKRRF